MKYRKIERTGDELSVLGYGCMRLPMRLGRIDEARATRQLRGAIDRGVNYVDTAMPYHAGQSEPFLGRALAGGYREKVKLATKLPPWNARERRDLESLLCVQLERLATDRIDYYLLHALDRKVWDRLRDLGVLEFLDRVKREGRIGSAGFSYHGDKDTFREVVDAYDWDFCQIQWNYLDEHNQAGTEGLIHAASRGLGVIVMEPLRGGNLAGEKVPRAVRALFDEAKVRRSAAEWALRWVWNRPEVTCVLSGMNDEGHIAENLRVAEEALPGSLTEEELALIERVRETFHRLTRVDCTGCRYCMPCPEGVDIPGCFEAYNNLFLFPEDRAGRLRYPLRLDGFSDEPGFASRCTKCKKCLKKCPQHLPIPDLLDEVSREFETPTLKAIIWTMRRVMAVQTALTLGFARRAERRRGR